MGEFKVELDDQLLKAFKERSYRLYGYKESAVKEGLEVAVKDFIAKVDVAEGAAELSSIKGLLKELKVGSVALQHKALGLWVRRDPDRHQCVLGSPARPAKVRRVS